MSQRFFQCQAKEVVDFLVKHMDSIYEHVAKEVDSIQSVFDSPKRLLEYYVEPNGQNVNPADLAEDNSGCTAIEPIFSMMNRFLGGEPRFSRVLILSDAGMGKTSLLVTLKLAELDKLTDSTQSLVLLKLGANTEADIRALSNRMNTVLLLDALDEDPVARDNFYTRLQDILRLTDNFRKTVITCRTQFLPEKFERHPTYSDSVVFHGFTCQVVFLSPFSDEQVDYYLQKRFNNTTDRIKAKQIVDRMNSLKFRPMLLSYVDMLLGRDDSLTTYYEIYRVLVDEWLNREQRKLDYPVKDTLFEACRQISIFLYKRGKDNRIDRAELELLCDSIGIRKELDEITIQGRSLLHKTSDKMYKFAHYSILEYFVAYTWLTNPERMTATDLIKLFILDNLSLTTTSLRSLDMTNVKILTVSRPSLNAQDSDFTGTSFVNCVLHDSAFNRSRFHRSHFQGCNLAGVNFHECEINELIIDNSPLDRTLWKNCSPRILKVKMCSFHHFQLKNALWESPAFFSCSFDDFTLAEVQWPDMKGTESTFNNGTLNSCNVANSTLDRATFRNVKAVETRFIGVIFTKTSFTRVTFEKCDLTTANLPDSAFDSCTLLHSDLTKIDASRALFSSTAFQSVNFSSGNFTATLYRDCKLIDCRYRSATLLNATFEQCSLIRADFSEVAADEIEFEKCDLDSAKLVKASLIGANFTNCNLDGTQFRGANLTSGTLHACEVNATDFREVNFSHADLKGLDLTKAVMNNSVFYHTNLSNCRVMQFDGNKLEGLRLVEAQLDGANLTNKEFEDSDFSRAMMEGTQLRRAKFERCDFREAHLAGANLEGAQFHDVDLQGANLFGVKAGGAKFKNVRIDSSTVLPTGLTEDQRMGMHLLPDDDDGYIGGQRPM